jgi:hypothetical protein
MIMKNNSAPRSPMCRFAMIAIGCAFGLLFVQIPALRASSATALPALDDKAPSLPVTTSFDKVAGAEAGPYVLKVQNDSKDALKVSAKVQLSLPSHADRKTRDIPEHVIDPGQAWTIGDLAAADKVTLTAPGFAPLELTVP